jgi:ribosomal protein L20
MEKANIEIDRKGRISEMTIRNPVMLEAIKPLIRTMPDASCINDQCNCG